MKNTKKILSLVLAVLMVVGLLSACGNGQTTQPTGTDGEKVQSKTAIVHYSSSGYSHTWLEKIAEAFNKAYADEGYKVELQIDFMGTGTNAGQMIPMGPDKNQIDLFIGANMDIEKVLDASKKTMRGEGSILLDLTDLFNSPAIGSDKQPESKTIAERFTKDVEYLYYTGAKEEYANKIYSIPHGTGLSGIIVNPAALEACGIDSENMPRTTDEFNAMCHKIHEVGLTLDTPVYPYTWAGANAPGYWSYLWYEYFAQYSGKEAFMNWCATMPESGDMINDGWMVYEDKGILVGLEALEPIFQLDYAPKGAVNNTHLEAQHELVVGDAAFMVSGEWVMKEMENEYFDEVSQCFIMDTPVVSQIGKDLGITDAQLSEAVKMIDEGKSNDDIIAAISGLDNDGAQWIRDARNIYSCGAGSLQMGCVIPAYADAIDVSKLFIQFVLSEEGCQMYREYAWATACYRCDSYEVSQPNTFIDSVQNCVKFDNGGEFISYDNQLSPVRSASGMLYFNSGAYVEPTTFRAMIVKATGNETAQHVYETERDYTKSHWEQFVAYAGLG